MPSIKEVHTAVKRASTYIDELDGLIEERDRLVQVLKLTPSNNDNYDLVTLLERLAKHLTYLQDDIHSLKLKGDDVSKFSSSFSDLIGRYNFLIEKLNEDDLDITEYIFKPKTYEEVKKDSKSVRFKDNLEEEPEELRAELMGSRPYEPYSDYEDVASFDATTNQQMFAQHQQKLLQQDESLDILHKLIRTSHQMGQSINSELDDHIIILNDLEQGVDNSAFRLNNARNKLADFRRKCQENGSLVTIITLTAILILLLVVLN